MFEDEIWRDVAGFEGIYAVSNHGRVKRLTGYKTATWPGRILHTHLTAGYPSVALWNKKGITVYIHRLVAIAFLGTPPTNRHEVNHIDAVKTNNHVTNLEWVTSSGNTQHAWDAGLQLHVKKRGERHGNSKLTDAQIEYIRTSTMQGRALAGELHVSESLVSLVRLGKHRPLHLTAVPKVFE